MNKIWMTVLTGIAAADSLSYVGSSRRASTIGRAFGRSFRHDVRGSCWRPGAEHLPTGPESRQVRRRREQIARRNATRRDSHCFR
ncbi:MAG: hypothetical protein JSS51_02510 [Planctomycetes bacterium]|nr:hypothetical protein [Planctomycetota bacterium]